MHTIALCTVRPHLRWIAGALIFLVACGSALAQEYGFRQTLRPSASGEGESGLRHGSRVAVDGAIAVVADRPSFRASTTLRTYTRTGRTWTRAPELTFRIQDVELLDMALSGNLLVVATRPAAGGQSHARVYELRDGRWRFEISFNASTATMPVAVEGRFSTKIVAYGVPDIAEERGHVIVRQRPSGASWSSSVELRPSVRQIGARFGSSVAIVSGAIVAGAPREDIEVSGQSRSDAGAAYLFTLTGTTWSQDARFVSPTPQSTTHFGHAVAISGLDEGTPDRVLVGAPREDTSTGAVYGYRRTSIGGPWTQSMRLTGGTEPPFQQFGSAVALDGGFGVIGANTYRIGEDMFQAGAVYGATFSTAFTSATLTRHFDPQPAQQARVGEAVAIDRDGPTVLVGVPQARMYSFNQNQGIVLFSDGHGAAPDFPALQRVFDLGQSTWGAGFGNSLAVDGDTLIVGAPNESVGSQIHTGAAYLYRRGGNGLYVQEARLQSPSGLSGDIFGSAVAVRGDIALVGAPGVAGSGTEDLGIVYVYRRSGGAWIPETALQSRCASASAERGRFGRRIAFDGTRALIGGLCPPESGNGLDLGTALYTRAPNGTWTGTVIMDALRMGSGAWDAGLAIVGMPVIARGEANYGQGSVFSFLSDAAGDWTMAGNAGAGTGTQGYGYDLAVDQGVLAVASHAPNYPVSVRRRVGNNFMPEASLIAADLGAADAARSVAVGGGRIAFGVPQLAVSQSQRGAVYVFAYHAGVWSQQQKLIATQPNTGSGFFGHALAFASDGALIVGTPYESDTFSSEGGVHIYSPPPTDLFANGFE